MRTLLPALLVLALPATGDGQTRFRFPAEDPAGVLFNVKPMIHVDHDPVDSNVEVDCVNYDGVGFPWCYDQHTGTDFLLTHGFGTMDAHDVPVVAAADGVVIEAVDGNYDRCHGEGLDVSCDGHPMVANRVEVQHVDGLVTRYYHLKLASVKVFVGQSVACGDLLGYVGSSGRSALPHLHFEVQDEEGAVIDPFAGSKSQALSYWTEQQGALGRPGDRCQNEPLLPDAGPVSDTGLDAASQSADARTTFAPRASGCSVGRTAESDLPSPLLLILLVGAWIRDSQRIGHRCRPSTVSGVAGQRSNRNSGKTKVQSPHRSGLPPLGA